MASVQEGSAEAAAPPVIQGGRGVGVSNWRLAALARKASGRVDGFVIEGPTAGGHNAPPRGPAPLDDRGEPIYGQRDVPDLEKNCALELPFWMAGSFAAPVRLAEAIETGAMGVQVGTAFAFCEESGSDQDLNVRVLAGVHRGKPDVFTDPLASPTGFPFKVAQLDGALSDGTIYLHRDRVCDLGYLRRAYSKPGGGVGYRCPSEPEPLCTAKGGDIEETLGRKCVCNGLLATVGLGQIQRNGYREPLLTAGDDLSGLTRILGDGCDRYTAADVIRHLLSETAGKGETP